MIFSPAGRCPYTGMADQEGQRAKINWPMDLWTDESPMVLTTDRIQTGTQANAMMQWIGSKARPSLKGFIEWFNAHGANKADLLNSFRVVFELPTPPPSKRSEHSFHDIGIPTST